MDVRPLVVINMTLAGCDGIGGGGHCVYHQLRPWLRGNLLMIDMVFDFSGGGDTWLALCSRVAKRLEDGYAG